jgi:hypothetical protein
MLSTPSLHLARFAALAALLALPAILFGSGCASQCAAACDPGVTLTIQGSADAVLGASSSYVLTIADDGSASGGFTCTSSDGSPFACTGGDERGVVTLSEGELTVDMINFAPTSFDVTLTRDGTTVVNAHVAPSYSTGDVCGETCEVAAATLYAQQ